MSKILIIGDSCIDEFVYCSTERLAPDVPIPILNVLETKLSPGMAMNVYRNIKTYISECEIITNQNWEENKKTRYMDLKTNHAFIRIDTHQKIEPYVFKNFDTPYDLVIISDYNKGFLSEKTIEQITKSHSNVFLDTKKMLGPWAKNASIIKINNFEYERSQFYIDSDLKEKIIHTRGPSGCDFKGKNYPVTPVEVKDSSGAGDSFMAALAIEFLRTSDIEKSIIYANLKASKVVTQKGVTII
jgi:D-beta-D-heptose 7-phosphate kinase/D-beta-D-heptose 1-phosphate adenosyltransferase